MREGIVDSNSNDGGAWLIFPMKPLTLLLMWLRLQCLWLSSVPEWLASLYSQDTS